MIVSDKLPTAVELPWFDVANTETPTPYNPLGAKGIGESATVGSTPAVHNAVVDALSHFGVRHIDIPCTPQAVWRAIRQAQAGTLTEPWRDPPAVFATLPERTAPDPGEESHSAPERVAVVPEKFGRCRRWRCAVRRRAPPMSRSPR